MNTQKLFHTTFLLIPVAALLAGCVNAPINLPLTRTIKVHYKETVHVETVPAGAEVYFQDNDMGPSPVDVSLDAGDIQVKQNGTMPCFVLLDPPNIDQATVPAWTPTYDPTLYPMPPDDSWRVEAVKSGYQSSTRLIQIEADDDVLRQAFEQASQSGNFQGLLPAANVQWFPAQASFTGGQNAQPALLGAKSNFQSPSDYNNFDACINTAMQDAFRNVQSQAATSVPEVMGHRSVLLVLSPAAAEQQQQEQQQQQQTVVIPGEGSATQTGSVLVTSDPANAEVDVDGAFSGNAPASLKLSAGFHIIDVKLDGYKPYHREMNVLAGSQLNLDAVLEK